MQDKHPIFVFTCERSGSTLLRCILDAHSEIYSPGEIGLGDLCQSLYNTILYTKGQSKDITSESERERIITNEVRKIVANQMDGYVKDYGKQIWCDKSPANVHHLDILGKIFPSAKCICLYRNCLDVVSSCINLSKMGFMSELCSYVRKHPDNLVLAMIENWIEKTTKILEFEHKNSARCFRVTYESMVLNPEKTLSELFAFLGVASDGYALESVFSGTHDIGQVNGDLRMLFSDGIFTSSIGKGSEIPLTYIPDWHVEKMNDMLAEIGYPCGWHGHSLIADAEQPVFYNSQLSDMKQKVSEIFEVLFPRMLEGICNDFSTVTGVCRFVISGNGGNDWVMDFNNRPVQIHSGTGDSDCTIAVSARNFLNIVNGRLGVVEAYEKGYIGASGNVNAAIKIGKVLFGGLQNI